MKCLNCNSKNIDIEQFTCWCGKPYKEMLMDGGMVVYESQCDCHKNNKKMKFAIPMDTRTEEMQRIISKDYPDPMPFSKPSEKGIL